MRKNSSITTADQFYYATLGVLVGTFAAIGLAMLAGIAVALLRG